MKKEYLEPEMCVMHINVENAILDGSHSIPGDTGDPTTPGEDPGSAESKKNNWSSVGSEAWERN